MEQPYSQELIIRTQKYFGKISGRDISPETAVTYLNSLAGLYESFIELAGGTAPVALARDGPPAGA